jgi:uncharacterized protein YacL
MGKAYAIGAVAGWLIVSMLYGKLLPALSLPSFLSVAIGGIIGIIIWAALSVGIGVKKENRIKKVTFANDDAEEKQEHGSEVIPIKTRTKTCPECVEQIRLEAVVCRYCGYQFKDTEIETEEKAEEIVPLIKHGKEIKKEYITIGIKKCPSCAEEIKLEARVCRYCGHHFTNEDISLALQEKNSFLAFKAKEYSKKQLMRKAKRNSVFAWILACIAGFFTIVFLFGILDSKKELPLSSGLIIFFIMIVLIPGYISYLFFNEAQRYKEQALTPIKHNKEKQEKIFISPECNSTTDLNSGKITKICTNCNSIISIDHFRCPKCGSIC